MFKPLDLQKTPWKDLGAHALALGRKTEEGARLGRLAPAGYARRRRGRVGVGAQGRGEGPWAALGLS